MNDYIGKTIIFTHSNGNENRYVVERVNSRHKTMWLEPGEGNNPPNDRGFLMNKNTLLAQIDYGRANIGDENAL